MYILEPLTQRPASVHQLREAIGPSASHPQLHLDSGHEFCRLDRLDEIIVGALGEVVELRRHVADAAGDEHRCHLQPGQESNRAKQLQPGHPREYGVEHDSVGATVRQLFER